MRRTFRNNNSRFYYFFLFEFLSEINNKQYQCDYSKACKDIGERLGKRERNFQRHLYVSDVLRCIHPNSLDRNQYRFCFGNVSGGIVRLLIRKCEWRNRECARIKRGDGENLFV